MLRPPIVAVCAAVLAGAAAAYADLVVDGTIHWLGGAPPGTVHSGSSQTISTVDYVYFSLARPGPVEIDVLSLESTDLPSADFRVVDVNGDGEIAFIDATIFLFRWDGHLDAEDYLLSVADNNQSGHGAADGSIHRYDPFCRVDLPAGAYAVAIGEFWLRLHGALTGVNPSSLGPTTAIEGDYWYVHDHGDYRLTIRGDVRPIPEPSSLLFLAAVTVWALSGPNKRRRRQQ